jgi:hypothetical protein
MQQVGSHLGLEGSNVGRQVNLAQPSQVHWQACHLTRRTATQGPGILLINQLAPQDVPIDDSLHGFHEISGWR